MKAAAHACTSILTKKSEGRDVELPSNHPDFLSISTTSCRREASATSARKGAESSRSRSFVSVVSDVENIKC